MKIFLLIKEELQDLKLHKFLLERYIVKVVCRRLSLDPDKGKLQYNIDKAEIYYDEFAPETNKQPELKDKPSEDGDKT